jgi:hypothetical protein
MRALERKIDSRLLNDLARLLEDWEKQAIIAST